VKHLQEETKVLTDFQHLMIWGLFKKLFLRMALREAPYAQRNKVPIGEVLQRYLKDPPTADSKLLEIASGCGTHAMYFSQLLPHIHWQPSDCTEECLQSIRAHLDRDERKNVAPPLLIDICEDFINWGLPHDSYDFVFNANMVHISPWVCSQRFFENCGKLLPPSGLIFMYGPFARDGVLEPESNRNFDESLKSRNSEWGIRDLNDLEKEAAKNGLKLHEIVEMPSNNKIIVWKKLTTPL